VEGDNPEKSVELEGCKVDWRQTEDGDENAVDRLDNPRLGCHDDDLNDDDRKRFSVADSCYFCVGGPSFCILWAS
jgi:hypothetical protein